jgi:vacuolar-type H+-ATPase subunit H
LTDDSQGGLSLLVDTERRLDAELAAARAQASRLVEAARTEATSLEQRLEAEIAASVSALKAEVDDERCRRLEQVVANARREVDAYDRVSDERAREIARVLVARLVAADGDAAP